MNLSFNLQSTSPDLLLYNTQCRLTSITMGTLPDVTSKKTASFQVM
jgi:hypothetical protein